MYLCPVPVFYVLLNRAQIITLFITLTRFVLREWYTAYMMPCRCWSIWPIAEIYTLCLRPERCNILALVHMPENLRCRIIAVSIKLERCISIIRRESNAPVLCIHGIIKIVYWKPDNKNTPFIKKGYLFL